VKSNLGHPQIAAGLAGVIKMVLAIKAGVLPATLHVGLPSPHVDWDSGRVEVVTHRTRWPATGVPRRAGISAFGISGTNAHVILEEAPAGDTPAPVRATAVLHGPATWLMSGRTGSALRAQAARLTEYVRARPDIDPADVGWSLATTRSFFAERAVVTATDRADLEPGLAAVAAGEPAPGVVSGSVGQPGKTVFVFPGQGSQWAGMGRELAASSPVFAARLAECAAALEPYVDWSLHEVLAGDLEAAEVVQPALWAVMVSLAAVWQAAGVEPDAVVGHSQGEIAAACVAGILSLDDAAKVVALRSKALAALAGRGGMLSVAEPADAMRERIASWRERLSVAAVNGPATTVVSGEPTALAELAAACAAGGVRAKPIAVNYASHSAQVEEIRAEILRALAGIAPVLSSVRMISAMTGQWLDGPEAGPGYWYDSLRAPVEFDRVVRALAGTGHGVFIEVSPHPVLVPAIAESLDDVTVTGTLRRDDGGPARMLASLAEVWTHGVPVDWPAVLPPAQLVDLPTYAFQHQHYWLQPQASAAGDMTAAGLGAAGHPLLGAVVELAGSGELVLTGRLSARSQPWLGDHEVAGVTVVPGTALVEMAVRAADAAGCGRVEDLTIEAPLVLPRGEAVQVQVRVGILDGSGRRTVDVFARASATADDGPWTRHASGLLASGAQAPVGTEDLVVWPPPDAVPVPMDGLYHRLAALGYRYGPAFRGLRAAWQRGDDLFAEVALPEGAAVDAAPFGIHPALLDAALHLTAIAVAGRLERAEAGTVWLPFAWSGVCLHAAGASALRVRLRQDAEGVTALEAADAAGAPVVSVRSLAGRMTDARQLATRSAGLRDCLFTTEWVPVPVPGAGLDATDDVVVVDARSQSDTGSPSGGEAEVARLATAAVLDRVQEWLADDRASSRLVVVTRGAVAVSPGERIADLPGAGVWGLVRSAQAENPGRIILVDLPSGGTAEDLGLLAAPGLGGAALGLGEPELAVRDGALYARRLTRPVGGLVRPEGGPWRLHAQDGTLDGLTLVPHPKGAAPLGPGQVRVAVRAAGLNFHDVVLTLGGIPAEGSGIGSEVAGVVMETGPGTRGLMAGDRVLGCAVDGFGPVTVVDPRPLVKMPEGWSFADAAAVPIAFTTAWYALIDLARAHHGERVLVHSAAGAVGMAAVSIARHLGLEVYGTASPAKHGVLAAMGLDAAHIASSRTAEFAEIFPSVDIVLNSLAGDLTDASLRLLRTGGRFMELGKTDIREPDTIARDHPGVSYRAFDIIEAGPARLGEILTQVVDLLVTGELARLPVRCWDIRRAPQAFRFMSQARHTGKIVLTIPPDPAAHREPGTVLVTGGTGLLGGLVARHLAATGRAAEVVLASRSGPAAPGVAGLAAEIAAQGTGARVIACDAADRGALAGLLAGIRPAGVVHAAGVLDDGVIQSLTPARIDAVMRPKADGAWHLHELTAGTDLEMFVLFSTMAATVGNAGQGNYSAANAFLDALAAVRQSAGLPAVSLAWGLWADPSAMTGHLRDADLARMASGGASALTAAEGLALLDAVLGRDEPLLVPGRLDIAMLRAQATAGKAPPVLLRDLVGPPVRPVAAAAADAPAADALRQRLAGMPELNQEQALLDLVRANTAAVLGHASAQAIDVRLPFRELGFDSLTAVELRNRLNAATGLRLPATLVFEYPTPGDLADQLREEIRSDNGRQAEPVRATRTRPPSALMDALLQMADLDEGGQLAQERGGADLIDAMDAESLVRMALDGESGDL
jgi:acyl transferase domain-containing protein/NADPH:quinone reductase-like Zn-dependent oxidoreductase/acyl carrier protein